MKATAQTVVIWLFLLFVAGKSISMYMSANSRANRMEANLKAATETAQQFKTRDQHNAVKLKAQELTISELRRINPQIISQLKNLYIAPARVQSYTQSTQELKAEIKATVKDSAIVPGTTEINSDSRAPEKIKLLKYRDKWISIQGIVDPDTAKIKILATDTIFTAIYKGERRRPWAWILSKRQYTAAATNRNPYISINVIETGVIKKK